MRGGSGGRRKTRTLDDGPATAGRGGGAGGLCDRSEPTGDGMRELLCGLGRMVRFRGAVGGFLGASGGAFCFFLA